MPVTSLTNVADWDTMLGYIRTALNSAGGWTFDKDLAAPDVAGAAGGRILTAINGDCFAGLRSTQSGSGANRLYLFDGIPPYGSFTTLDALPGNSGQRVLSADYTSATQPPARCINPQFAGPFPTAYIFTNNPSTYCHIVVEVTAGVYRHIAFGNAKKNGTWTGGGYYASQYWSQTGTPQFYISTPGSDQHQVLFDNVAIFTERGFTLHYENGAYHWGAPFQATLNGVSRRTCFGSMRGGFGTAFRNIQQSSFSGQTAIVPVTLWPYTSTDSPATTRNAAVIPDMFEINLRNFAPGSLHSIGANDYLVFPMAQKGAPADRPSTENSGYFGLAYKKIP